MKKGKFLPEGSESGDTRTKKEKQESKKIFLEKKFNVLLFCDTFKIEKEKFFTSGKRPLTELFPDVTWKNLSSKQEEKFFQKIRKTISLIIERKGYAGTLTDYMINSYNLVVSVFGKDTDAEKCFLRDMRKHFENI